MQIRILTYNIHKGRRAYSKTLILRELKAAMEETGADIVCLQEVQGAHSEITQPQFEELADTVWSHYAYAQNALTQRGHHGNAILSRFPIRHHRNMNLAWMKSASRSILSAEIDIPDFGRPVGVMCVHFGLIGLERDYQLRKLRDHISGMADDMPLIVAGDFNDWGSRLHRHIKRDLPLEEATETVTGTLSRTFPAIHPILPVDRIYVRHMTPVAIDRPQNVAWQDLSDHLPLIADVRLSDLH